MTQRFSGQPQRSDDDDSSCSASDAFTLLWAALGDVLGQAATATLIRRSVRQVSPRRPDLRDVVITRRDLHYTYTVPSSWTGSDPEATAALRDLVSELWPLLFELTGPVVVRRLQRNPALARCGVLPAEE